MKQLFGDIVLVEGLNELNVELTPVPMANLSGIITDSLDGSLIAGAIVTLGNLSTYTDVNGIYSFYGLAPGSYNGLVEKEHYHPLGFTANLVSGDNFLDRSIDPILLASVVIGIRTRASEPGLATPSEGYYSKPIFNVATGPGWAYDSIPNTSFYTDYTVILPINPATEQAWRETDLEKYQFGVWLWASMWATGETRCTQLWVVANYPDGSSRVLRPYEGPDWEKVADVVPDEDASYISFTCAGLGIGAFFSYKVR